MTLPDPNEYALATGRTMHDGYHYTWRQGDAPSVDLGWEVTSYAHARRCRYGSKGDRCPNHGVAVLWRSPHQPWAYCADHLFGRLLCDGHIWVLVMVEDCEVAE